MPPKASWKGQLKISLVSFPVRMYNATTTAGRITLNQLHKKTHRRLKQQMVDPELGAADRGDIVKGYEYEKDRYVIVDESDLEKIKLATNKVVEIVQFIDGAELDTRYLNSPYFVAPDGPVAEDAFRVIRQALSSSNKIGIGRVVIANREHIIALQPKDRGFVLTTLRFMEEVRNPQPYFEEIGDGNIDEQQLQLAEQLIENLGAPFEPNQFKDRYQESLRDIIKAKIEGTEPVIAQDVEVGKVINLMDALKQSVEGAKKKKPPVKSVKKKKKSTTAKKKAKRA